MFAHKLKCGLRAPCTSLLRVLIHFAVGSSYQDKGIWFYIGLHDDRMNSPRSKQSHHPHDSLSPSVKSNRAVLQNTDIGNDSKSAGPCSSCSTTLCQLLRCPVGDLKPEFQIFPLPLKLWPSFCSIDVSFKFTLCGQQGALGKFGVNQMPTSLLGGHSLPSLQTAFEGCTLQQTGRPD